MERASVVVVGGGQSGLAVSYHLVQRGIDHVVLERDHSGDSWRHRWDSFCLVTPNQSLRLPGFPYDGDDPNGFIPRDQIAEYVERYAASFDAPVKPNTAVTAVAPRDGGWQVTSDAGEWLADAVVIATGGYQHPTIPPAGRDIDESIAQVHSHDYRNPGALPDGGVLVVGSAQSGTQIVDDLRLTGRDVWLAVSRSPRGPRRYRGRDIFLWFGELGLLDRPGEDESARFAASVHVSGRDGGKDINLRSFGRDGVHLTGRVERATGTVLQFSDDVGERLDAADEFAAEIQQEVDEYIDGRGLDAPPDDNEVVDWVPDGTPTEVDLDAAGIGSIVWATGYHLDFSWIDPDVFGERGYPVQRRGVTAMPGLYFVGLPHMYTPGSSLFWGIGTDAEYIVEHIEAR